MPHYTFELLNGLAPLSDDTGIDAPDREQAASYGKAVARELMHLHMGMGINQHSCVYPRREWELDAMMVSHRTSGHTERLTASALKKYRGQRRILSNLKHRKVRQISVLPAHTLP